MIKKKNNTKKKCYTFFLLWVLSSGCEGAAARDKANHKLKHGSVWRGHTESQKTSALLLNGKSKFVSIQQPSRNTSVPFTPFLLPSAPFPSLCPAPSTAAFIPPLVSLITRLREKGSPEISN